MSGYEGDGCTYSLIAAIITQWWHNKLSNNYSLFVSLSLPPTWSQQTSFAARTHALYLFQLLRNNYMYVIHFNQCQGGNKTNKREATCFLLSSRCWDYYAQFTRLLTKLLIMPYIYKKCTAWRAEGHPLSRYYWTLLPLLSLQRQGSINWSLNSWYNETFLAETHPYLQQ